MPAPIGVHGEFHSYPPIRTRTVAGAVAGNITVTGINPGDTLMSVQNVAAAGANLADEFTITAANTINNAGGTSTAAMVLLIIWYKAAIGLVGR